MVLSQLLTDEFIAGYESKKPPFNELGEFVFYRTYSRWLPDQQRRETWFETCRRAVEYNCRLAETSQEEAQKLFDNMFNLRQFLSGRTLWVGGTEVAQKYPMSNFNCSFVVIDSIEAFEDLFYLLMVGTGVGFRILKSDVEQLTTFRSDVAVVHKDYDPVPAPLRCDHSQIRFEYNDHAVINVGDSKEGWIQALGLYFKILTHKDFRQVKTVTFVYDHVRPKGERLKVFGGTASGYESLRNMFAKIDATVKGKYAPVYDGRLRPIHVLDICNIIGENVVVGGVRRTAEIALLDANDEETLYAKKNLTPDRFHRFMSNNSIFYEDKPTREQLAKQFTVLQNEGEPCFVNAEAARKRRPNFHGVNPCVCR